MQKMSHFALQSPLSGIHMELMVDLQCIVNDLGLVNVFKMVCGGRVGSTLSNPLWSQYYTYVPIPVHCSNDNDVVILLWF
jgi:hypothetical protein